MAVVGEFWVRSWACGAGWPVDRARAGLRRRRGRASPRRLALGDAECRLGPIRKGCSTPPGAAIREGRFDEAGPHSPVMSPSRRSSKKDNARSLLADWTMHSRKRGPYSGQSPGRRRAQAARGRGRRRPGRRDLKPELKDAYRGQPSGGIPPGTGRSARGREQRRALPRTRAECPAPSKKAMRTPQPGFVPEGGTPRGPGPGARTGFKRIYNGQSYEGWEASHPDASCPQKGNPQRDDRILECNRLRLSRASETEKRSSRKPGRRNFEHGQALPDHVIEVRLHDCVPPAAGRCPKRGIVSCRGRAFAWTSR